MIQSLADAFNLLIIIVALASAVLYIRVIRKNHTTGIVRSLDYFAVVIALYTAGFYTYTLVAPDPTSLQAWIDRGVIFLRPLVLLFLVLLCCRAYVRCYLKTIKGG